MSELRDFVEFEEGNIPLIISVPHGGVLEYSSIPERTTGVLGIDKGTFEFSKNLIEQISLKFKAETTKLKVPFYIISKVRRSKVDLNRDKSEAYNQNSFLAREIYNFYHTKIQEWVFNNLKMYSRSLMIDIHGFENDSRPPGFRDVDVILGANNLESFFPEPIAKSDWGKNLRGKLIQKFLQMDIPIAPGHPRRREYVLSGGYITRKYGASHVPKSQTIQIEFSDRIRIDDKELRESVIRVITDILFKDLTHVYDY